MTGRKLNYKRDLRFEFGSYIEARNPTGDSSIAGRTNGMIPLLSSGNVQGLVHCFSLETKRVVVRYSWTVLPMPDIVISMLNRLADEDKLVDRITRDPEFRVRNQVIRLEADNNEQSDLDTNCSPQLGGIQSDPSIDDRVEPPSDNRVFAKSKIVSRLTYVRCVTIFSSLRRKKLSPSHIVRRQSCDELLCMRKRCPPLSPNSII